MNHRETIELINHILRNVSDSKQAEAFEVESADYQLLRLHRVTVSDDNLAKLVNQLRRYKELAELEGGIYHSGPGLRGSIKLEDIAHWLLAQSRNRTPDKCLSELFSELNKNSSIVQEIVPIWGFNPRHSLSFDNGLKILPIEELPLSSPKDTFTDKKRYKVTTPEHCNLSIGAALVYEFTHAPIYEPPESETAKRDDRIVASLLRRIGFANALGISDGVKRALQHPEQEDDFPKPVDPAFTIQPSPEEICAVVALFCPQPIFKLGHWYQRPINIPLAAKIGGCAGPTIDHPFRLKVEKQDYPYDEIEKLVKQHQALRSSVQRQLRIPLLRLNQSRRNSQHHEIEDAALDLGIAAEALLLQKSEANLSISRHFQSRGAWLLRHANVETETASTLKKAYTIRSKVIHTGTAVDPHAPRKDWEEQLSKITKDVESGQAVCTQMIIEIIRRTEFPNWPLFAKQETKMQRVLSCLRKSLR